LERRSDRRNRIEPEIKRALENRHIWNAMCHIAARQAADPNESIADAAEKFNDTCRSDKPTAESLETYWNSHLTKDQQDSLIKFWRSAYTERKPDVTLLLNAIKNPA
jgi:hypothetical protein